MFLFVIFFNPVANFMHHPLILLLYFLGADSCRGDSGGPLVYRDSADAPWTQVGVVSYGSEECAVGKPGVYVRVASFLDWIESKLKP